MTSSVQLTASSMTGETQSVSSTSSRSSHSSYESLNIKKQVPTGSLVAHQKLSRLSLKLFDLITEGDKKEHYRKRLEEFKVKDVERKQVYLTIADRDAAAAKTPSLWSRFTTMISKTASSIGSYIATTKLFNPLVQKYRRYTLIHSTLNPLIKELEDMQSQQTAKKITRLFHHAIVKEAQQKLNDTVEMFDQDLPTSILVLKEIANLKDPKISVSQQTGMVESMAHGILLRLTGSDDNSDNTHCEGILEAVHFAQIGIVDKQN